MSSALATTFGAILTGSAAATCYGDSITVGVGADTPAASYASLVAARQGWALSNLALSGSQLQSAGQMDAIYGTTPACNGPYWLLSGFNDMRNYGADPVGQTTFRDALYAAVGWLATPQAAKVTAQSSVAMYSGTWFGAAHGSKCTANNGDSVTFTVQGSTLYVVSERVAGQSGQFLLTVDGATIGTFDCYGNAVDASGRAYCPFLVRVTGLHTGKHSATITKTAGDFVYFVWGASPSCQAIGAKVYVGNCLRMTAAAYALGAPTWSNGSDATVREYNALIAGVCGDLSSDGLMVRAVNASNAYDPDAVAQISADGVHPSDIGHANIANAFLAAMNPFKT